MLMEEDKKKTTDNIIVNGCCFPDNKWSPGSSRGGARVPGSYCCAGPVPRPSVQGRRGPCCTRCRPAERSQNRWDLAPGPHCRTWTHPDRQTGKWRTKGGEYENLLTVGEGVFGPLGSAEQSTPLTFVLPLDPFISRPSTSTSAAVVEASEGRKGCILSSGLLLRFLLGCFVFHWLSLSFFLALHVFPFLSLSVFSCLCDSFWLSPVLCWVFSACPCDVGMFSPSFGGPGLFVPALLFLPQSPTWVPFGLFSCG